MEEKFDLHRCHLSTSMISFLHESILYSQLHKKVNITKKKNKNLNYNQPKNPRFCSVVRCTPLLCCSVGVFIGDGRSRVLVQLLHQIWYPNLSTHPRKRGYGRVFAAVAQPLATRFRAWPPLVRPSGYILLDLAYRLFILKIWDNLGSKLP